MPFWLYSTEYKVNLKYKNEDINSGINNIFYGVLSNVKEKEANVKFKFIPFDANKHLSNKITKSLNHLIIVINGQTGKVAGMLPIDKNKYRIISLISFIVIFIILMLIAYSLRWRGLL